MDYTFNKAAAAAAASFDYMNSTAELFSTKNEFIYMPCHSSNSSSSSIFAHDLGNHHMGGHSAADDYFNINYENNAEYNTDLLLFDSNDGKAALDDNFCRYSRNIDFATVAKRAEGAFVPIPQL